MKLLFQYLKDYKRLFLGALGLAVTNQVFSLLDPQIYRVIIDRYATQAGDYEFRQFLSGILILIIAAMAAALISRVAKNFQDYYVNVITQKLGTRLYGDAVAHALALPFAIFEDKRSGEVLQTLQKARTDVQVFVTSLVNIVFFSLVGIIFVVVYAFIVHWLIGLVYFFVIPLIGFTTYTISKKIKASQAAIVKEMSALAGSTTETLRNVELVKSLGLESQETGRLNYVNDKILGLELTKVKLIRYLSFSQGTMVNTMRSVLLLLLLWLIFKGPVSLGEFFTLWIYSFFIFNPLGEFGNVAAQYREASASLEQLQQILNIPKEEKPIGAVRVGALQNLVFKNVSFQYASGSDPSVKNLNFEITAGQTVALAGPSGSGKSTIIKLILGLYKPTAGNFEVNGIDANRLDYEHFRAKIGYVSQDTQLFAGTIRENLVFVRPASSDDECLKVLQQAESLAIIERGGLGLDTKIGEGGIKISGGEKQRLAIARALLRNPELIIFDEATSSLDSITEKAITETIKQIAKSRPNLMIVLVAHRLSTVAHADKIYVLEKGNIVERDTHRQLLQNQNLYAALWREQAGSA